MTAYGTWRSPITAELLTTRSARLAEPLIDGEQLYWLESRPDEQGRNALITRGPDGYTRELLPAPHSVRTRAHEYGGGSYSVHHGVVYAVLDSDQRIYRLSPGSSQPAALSPEGPYRYADLHVDARHQRLLCIREDHSEPDAEERNEIVALALDGSGTVEVLVTGADFYSNPRVSPNGTQLSWLSWQHPQMPWDGTECHLAQLDEQGAIISQQLIAGSWNESVFQPEWSPTGTLFFVSDRTGWWNLYRWNGDSSQALCPMEAEFATPQWNFGMSTFGFLDSETILCCYSQGGHWQLATLSMTGQLTDVACGLTDISALSCSASSRGKAAFLGANVSSSPALWRYTPSSQTCLTQASTATESIPEGYLSQPRAVSYPTSDNETAHGFFYPPHNPDCCAPENTLPPLLVMCHGGPTGATESSLNLKIQYWTSRGFAVLDVNYRGSTGYGRPYRERLKRNWGVTDVIDVCGGVDYLVQENLVNPDQVAIRGSSAGGYTVLAALTFSDHFRAGASLYGIGDLETLARDTHKFEARYLDTLVGPYPEDQETYRARSPIHHIEQLHCPVIFLQGLQDKIVPPEQAEAMVQALIEKHIANAYVTFPTEGHGFRQAESIQRAIEAELYFYSKVFGFEPADTLQPLVINHLAGSNPA